jgi:hypothetical protein
VATPFLLKKHLIYISVMEEPKKRTLKKKAPVLMEETNQPRVTSPQQMDMTKTIKEFS